MKIITVSSAHVPRFNAQSDRLIYVGISSVQAFEILGQARRFDTVLYKSVTATASEVMTLWRYRSVYIYLLIYLFRDITNVRIMMTTTKLLD